MSVTSVSYSGAASGELDSVSPKKIDLKKIISSLTDDEKDELKEMIKTIQASGSDVDIDSLVSNASDGLKAAFSNNSAELSKFLEGVQKSAENGGTMPSPPSEDGSSSSSGASLNLSNFAKVNNAISSLSDDGKEDLLSLIKQASLLDSSSTSITDLLKNASDEVQSAFTAQGLDLGTFLQKSTRQQSSITGDYSSKLKGQKPPTIDDLMNLLETESAS